MEMRLTFNANLCTGCCSCELACSFFRTGSFAPSTAGLEIYTDRNTGNVELSFKEDCSAYNGCLHCACFCPTGALVAKT